MRSVLPSVPTNCSSNHCNQVQSKANSICYFLQLVSPRPPVGGFSGFPLLVAQGLLSSCWKFKSEEGK